MELLEPYTDPQIIFDVPPSSFGRFRYKSENRKTALEGEGGGPITLRLSRDVVENSQLIEIQASLVTRHSQPHWHELVGAKHVRVPTGPNADGIVYFSDLSVIVNKSNETNQSKKEDNRVVRLYFEMKVTTFTGEERFAGLLSECIFNSKLEIVDISACSGPARGGNKLIILCTKARKQSTVVRFHDYANPLGNQYGWSTDLRMGSASVREMNSREITFHQQAAIIINAPAFHNQEITTPTKVSITIFDKDDQIVSRPLEYFYLPNETQVKGENFGRKKRKTQEESLDYFNSYPKLNQQGDSSSARSSGSSDTFFDQITNGMGYTNLSNSLPSLQSLQNFSVSPRSSLTSPTPSTSTQVEIKKEDDKSVKYFAATGDVRFLLLSKQKSIQVPDQGFDTPLHHAILSNNHQAFSALCEFATIETINCVNSDGETPLFVATWHRNLEAIKKLKSMKADLSIKDPLGRTALHLATEMNFTDGIGELLRDERRKDFYLEDISYDGLTPLLAACSKNFCDTASVLIEMGADTTKTDPSNGYSPLIYAVRNESMEIISSLFNANKLTPELIKHQDNYGNTALHHSIMLGKFMMAQKLISFGASPEVTNQYLQNCYMIADELYKGSDYENLELILKGFRLYEETSKNANFQPPPRYSLITKEVNTDKTPALTSAPTPTSSRTIVGPPIKEEDWVDLSQDKILSRENRIGYERVENKNGFEKFLGNVKNQISQTAATATRTMSLSQPSSNDK